jgi:menaquinone-dependent protoporphyrinogen oxidase
MANVLVAFASHEGQTRKVAERIATVLRVRHHEVELSDLGRTAPGTLDLSRFGAVLVGSPIRAQGYLRPVVRFVRTHRSQLERLPTLFFSVGLAVLSKIGDGRAQTMKIVEKLVAETGWHPGRIELVAGALKYTRYNFLVRFVMRRISRREGGDTDTSRDHEYTDWDAVDRFAVAFLDQVEGSRPRGDALRSAPEARA